MTKFDCLTNISINLYILTVFLFMHCNINNCCYCIWYAGALWNFGENSVVDLIQPHLAFDFAYNHCYYSPYVWLIPVTYLEPKIAWKRDWQPFGHSKNWKRFNSLPLSRAPFSVCKTNQMLAKQKHIKNWINHEVRESTTDYKNNCYEKSVTLIIIFSFKYVYMIQTKNININSGTINIHIIQNTKCSPSGAKYSQQQHPKAVASCYTRSESKAKLRIKR